MLVVFLYSSIGSVVSLWIWGRKLGRRGVGEVLVEWLWWSVVVVFVVSWECVLRRNVVEVEVAAWFQAMDSNLSLRMTERTVSMACLVELVSTLVIWYSVSYVGADPSRSRLLLLILAFKLSMMLLVTSTNMLTLFVGWEGVGVVSFGLITYWYGGLANGRSGMQAMVMNKVGDLCLLLGMAIFFLRSGGLEWGVGEVSDWWLRSLMLVGCFAKSGQAGLHLWLPNAMAAPTPISALLHSATMVTAGVYLGLVLDLSGKWLILLSGYSLLLLGGLGLVEYDYKRIVAYSTGSQLGYMLVGVGLGELDAGYFHLLVHGVFKSTLFLSSGLVLFVCSDEQDIRRLGGLVALIPLGYVASLVGTGSLLGLPYLGGYYSKEALILSSALVDLDGWWLLVVGVLCTSYYSVRVLVRVYCGTFKGDREIFGEVGKDSSTLYWVLLVLSQLVVVWGYALVDVVGGVGGGSGLPLVDVEGEGWLGDVVLVVVILGSFLGYRSLGWSRYWLGGLSDSWGYERFYKAGLVRMYAYGEEVVWKVSENGIGEGVGGWGGWRILTKRRQMTDGKLWGYLLVILLWVVVVVVGR